MRIPRRAGARVPVRHVRPVSGVGPDRVSNGLILLLFALVPVEGILRKWVFPSLHELFYFIRDPFVLALYLWYWLINRNRLLIPSEAGALSALVTLIGVAVAAVAQFRLGMVSPVVAGIGLRSYLLFVPLAYIVWKSMDAIAFARLLRLTIAFSIVLAPLSVAQFYSGGGVLNVGAGGAPPPGLALGFLRTTGFMASDAQHASFLGFCWALLLAALVSGAPSVNRWWLIAGLAATAVSIAFSGSRAVWFLAGIALVCACAASLPTILRRPTVVLQMSMALVVPAAGIGVAYYAFPEALKAFLQRNEEARTFSDETAQRILGMITPDQQFLNAPLGGGIGKSTTAGGYIDAGERMFALAENDIDRNIAELGPLMGGWFVAFRFAVAFWLIWSGVRAAMWGYPAALVLASYAATSIAVGQITMHTVYAHLAWMAAGLAMAAARSPDQRHIGAGSPLARSLPRASLRLAALRSRGLRLSARRVSS